MDGMKTEIEKSSKMKKRKIANDSKPEKHEIEENFNSLLSKFPNRNPEELYEKAVEFAFTKENISLDDWITRQGKVIKEESNQNQEIIDFRLQYVMSMLNSSSSESLTEKVTEFEYSDLGDIEFKSWVEKEIEKEKNIESNKYTIDSRLQYALTTLDYSSFDQLRKAASDFKFNEAGEQKFRIWVKNEAKRQENQAILEGRYQALLALFPDKEPENLAAKAAEFSYDEKGNEAFKTWIDENKMSECGCCFDSDIEIRMLSCPAGHYFCKECIKRGSEAAFGDGKSELSCFEANCKEQFELKTIERGLQAATFSKWVPKIQSAEIEKAGVSGLTSCPFCHYSVIMEIPPEQDPTFRCQHPDCGKKSCRLCHEICHAPLRCDQVEKDEEVKKRIYIENKMSEAMFRRCYKCSRPVVKEGGCHWVICSCGAGMCYFSQSPICSCHRQLMSQTLIYESNRINIAAQEALKEVHEKYPGVQLKIDPTKPKH